MPETRSTPATPLSETRSTSAQQNSFPTPGSRYTLEEAIAESNQIQGIGRYLCHLSGTKSFAIADIIMCESTYYLYEHFNRDQDWFEATLEYLMERGDIELMRRFMTDGWLLAQAEEAVAFYMELDAELRQVENQDDPHLIAVLECLDYYPAIFHQMLYQHASGLVSDSTAGRLISDFGRGGEEDTFDYFHREHSYPSELLEELERHGKLEAAEQLRTDPLLQAMGSQAH